MAAPRRPYTPRRDTFVAPPGHAAAVQAGPAFEAVAELMARRREIEGPRPTADGTLLRGSFAGSCTRRIAFETIGVETTNAIETDTLVTFEIGKQYHETIQQALVDNYGARCEVQVSYKEVGLSLSGHADAVYETDMGSRIVVEIKSMKDYAWKLAVEGNRFDNHGPGPKKEHLQQASIYGLAPQIDAAGVHMIYVNKDNGQLAEWVFGMDEAIKHFGRDVTSCRELAETEMARLAKVAQDIVDGWLPERVVPGYGTVHGTPPRPDSKDKPWMCRYCAWRDLCAQLPAIAFPLKDTTWNLTTTTTSSSTS